MSRDMSRGVHLTWIDRPPELLFVLGVKTRDYVQVGVTNSKQDPVMERDIFSPKTSGGAAFQPKPSPHDAANIHKPILNQNHIPSTHLDSTELRAIKSIERIQPDIRPPEKQGMTGMPSTSTHHVIHPPQPPTSTLQKTNPPQATPHPPPPLPQPTTTTHNPQQPTTTRNPHRQKLFIPGIEPGTFRVPEKLLQACVL